MPRNISCRGAVIGGLGLLMTLLGAILSFFWPSIFDLIIGKEMMISPTSSAYEKWKATEVPLHTDFYFFNWTNPEEIRKPDSKPAFVEMGPYRFREFHEKVNITWNANRTVTYKQIRRWHFDAENSNGSLSDQVTTLNPVPLSACFMSHSWNYFLKKSLSAALTTTGVKMQVTKPVREFLFEGYDDPILSMGSKLPVFTNIKVPFDKFGWFYKRNGSAEFDGVLNMATGQADMGSLGELRRWNYANRTDYYRDHCGQINGSAGGLWPPGQTKEKGIAMYSPDLCRSIHFDFTEEVAVEGVTGYRYSGGPGIVDNGTSDPSKECFCGGQCVPSGALNVSKCRFGAPVFISYPHFYQADPYYLRQVLGLEPVKEKHRLYITLEPNTGVPLDVAARFQVNLLLEPYPSVGLYKDVPTVMFPMMWFDIRATLTSELATSLNQLLQLPTWGLISSLVLLVAGLIVMLVILVLTMYRSNKLTQVNGLEKSSVEDMMKEKYNPLIPANNRSNGEMQAIKASSPKGRDSDEEAMKLQRRMRPT